MHPILLAALAPIQPETIVLSRGASLAGQRIGYWAVEDATLDSVQAEANLGGSAFLAGGPGKAILIRFGDLRRAIGPGRRIVQATLTLVSTGAENIRLASAADVLVPWNEGPAQVIQFGNLGATPGKAAPRSATYRFRRAGERPAEWQQPGCSGPADAALLPSARGTMGPESRYSISGIETAIRRAYEQPGDASGLALRFEGNCEFFSSQAPRHRPTLTVVTEPSEPISGPDLEVALVARSGWPAPPGGTGGTFDQDGSPVELAPAAARGKGFPGEGSAIRYTAVVRNRGSVASNGFSIRWGADESWGAWTELIKPVPPGGVALATIERPFRGARSDARSAPLSVEVRPIGPDVDPSNHRSDFYESALGVHVTGSWDDVAQARSQIELINRTMFPYSRFSHAPDGILERLVLHSAEVEGTTLGDPAGADLSWRPSDGDLAAAMAAHRLGRRPGAVAVPAASPVAGVTGIGDTRFEGSMPGSFHVPLEPVANRLAETALGEPTRMFSAAEAYLLNSAVGVRGPGSREGWYDLPGLLVARAMDFEGRPLAGALLLVRPISAPDGSAPIARIQVDSNGTLLFPNRPVPKNHARLKPNPFGVPAFDGSNLVYRVDAEYRGQTARAFMTAWQLIELRARGGAAPAIYDFRFNFSSGPIDPPNLAKGRVATDSAGTLPARLAPLFDDDPATAAELPQDSGYWLEVDLGRDRALGEVEIVAGPFWESFEVSGYSTGQTAADAVPWIREPSFSWRRLGWGSTSSGTTATVPYRAFGQRFRFLRFRPLTAAKSPATVWEIRIRGVLPLPEASGSD